MTQQARSAETRARILDAAQALFAEQGFDAAGVAAICQRANVSKGAFYHHFASKQALFVALLDQWLAGLDDGMAAAAATPLETLQAMVGLLQQVFRDAAGRLTMYLEFWRQASRDEAIWQAAVAPFDHYQALLAGLIEQGIADGSLRPCDSGQAARVLVSMAVGMVLQSALDPSGNDWQQSAQAGIDLLLHGLLNKNDG